jgi:hypothetical protein
VDIIINSNVIEIYINTREEIKDMNEAWSEKSFYTLPESFKA